MLDLSKQFISVSSFPSKENKPTPAPDTPIKELTCVQEPHAKPDLSFEAVAAAAPTVVRASHLHALEDEEILKVPSSAKWLK